MLIPPNTAPVEYDFIANAEREHTLAGYDFGVCFDSFFRYGWVNKGPGHFLMGGHDPKRQDAWLVWWAELHPKREVRTMMRVMMKCVPYYKPWIGWARPHKGRFDVKYYSTDRLYRFTHKPAAHAPQS